jgi:hypothetical protein
MRRLFGSTTMRAAVVAALVATVVAFPLGVLANHQFTDVPTSYTFHGDIDHVYDARITNGCTATKFCPEDNVTRGQMAAFLERAGGRATYGTNSFTTVAGTEVALATVTIRAGNVTGGTAFVQLQASGYHYTSLMTDETGCNAGCQMQERIFQGADQVGNYGVATLHNVSSTSIEVASFSISVVVPIPTGVDTTFTLKSQRVTGTGTITGVGELTATYFPFGGTGGNSLAGSVKAPVVSTEATPAK